MMTEDEAKTKPCIGPAPSNTGTVAEGVPNYVCRASACLAWRWSGGAFPLPNDPSYVRTRYSGFCGLAGNP